MSKIKRWSLKTKIFACLGVVLLGIIGLWGYNYYMEQQKVNNLYKHGFRLLEEQIATYIVENYSGVSKVEFSPIFVDGDGGYTARTANVVPVIYDEYGNKAQLGGEINNFAHPRYGLLNYLRLDFDIEGNEIIELSNDLGEYVEIKSGDTLSKTVKWSTNEDIDSNIEDLNDEKRLKGVRKSPNGSTSAKIKYNLTIKNGVLEYDTD